MSEPITSQPNKSNNVQLNKVVYFDENEEVVMETKKTDYYGNEQMRNEDNCCTSFFSTCWKKYNTSFGSIDDYESDSDDGFCPDMDDAYNDDEPERFNSFGDNCSNNYDYSSNNYDNDIGTCDAGDSGGGGDDYGGCSDD